MGQFTLAHSTHIMTSYSMSAQCSSAVKLLMAAQVGSRSARSSIAHCMARRSVPRSTRVH